MTDRDHERLVIDQLERDKALMDSYYSDDEPQDWLFGLPGLLIMGGGALLFVVLVVIGWYR